MAKTRKLATKIEIIYRFQVIYPNSISIHLIQQRELNEMSMEALTARVN